MKYTLLQMVQRILSALDAESVNSINDTSEALQVATILEDQFFLMVNNNTIPEHKEMTKLTAASDSAFPTHFRYPDLVTRVEEIWYATDGSYTYKKLQWLEPQDFVDLTDGRTSNYTNVSTKVGSTNLRIFNNSQPTYYTSFDDDWIVCDAHKSTVDATLTSDKSRAYVVKMPTWNALDRFTPDIDDGVFPVLLQKAKVVAFRELKNGADSVEDREASRAMAALQSRKRKTPYQRQWSPYGRHQAR